MRCPRWLPVSSAAAGLVAAAAAAAGVGAATTSVPLHRILAAPGGVLTLPDGRQLGAKVYDLGGCVSTHTTRTGAPRGATTSNFTLLLQHTGPPCVVARRGGGGGGGGSPTVVGAQAIRVVANGWTFAAPSLTVEDVDANGKAPEDASSGWRDTITAVGVADGKLVRPAVSVAPDALVGVTDGAVAASTLAEAGLPAGSGGGSGDAVALQSVAYASWSRVENVGPDDAALGRGVFSFGAPLSELLVLYSLAQAEAADDRIITGAYVSGVEVPDGCQCAAGPPEQRRQLVPGAVAGECHFVTREVTPVACDLRGDQWCESRSSSRWVATAGEGSGGVGCSSRKSTVQRVVTSYKPVKNFSVTP
ncbi:hypothetical protein I4F81_010511 [Pyropia yezoensis]|uniref:Uncharacterized protein n=1 Tax=Pyropia yezoensis TaxID=2788 RepID=A0ACC3CDI5_PYRYE|nr:hypothetical protein I4F81_010511 [Neopyropia yezoensis]